MNFFIILLTLWMKHGGIFLGESIKKNQIVLYVIMHLENKIALNF